MVLDGPVRFSCLTTAALVGLGSGQSGRESVQERETAEIDFAKKGSRSVKCRVFERGALHGSPRSARASEIPSPALFPLTLPEPRVN